MSRSRERRAEPVERAAIIERFGSSGLTQIAFCKAEGISPSTFQNWLKRERTGDAFAEVISERTPRTSVEVLFPDGTALRIRGE